jgi:thiamine pyrophosphate-dependent acetolactate synthase large subunit-like protein
MSGSDAVARSTGAGAITGGQALTGALSAHGVEHLWGIPGTHNLGIYATLGVAGIRHLPARHEQGAAFAADGFARASGRPGVCLTTSGPAVLNAATALGQSWSDSVPVLLVSPGMPSRHPGRGNGHLHETKDLHQTMGGLIAYSHRVGSVDEIPVAVAQAFASMRSGRPRPVHIEIPYDLLIERARVTMVEPIPVTPLVPDDLAVERAARCLAGARSPVIIAGGGAVGAVDALTRVAGQLRAAVVTTFNGRGAVKSSHPLHVGCGLHLRTVRALVEASDAVLAVGTELAPVDLWDGPLPIDGRLVRIDADALQMVTNARPDVCVAGDAAVTLSRLSDRLEQIAVPRDDGDREEAVARWRRAARDEAERESARWGWVLDPIGDALGRDGALAGDSATICYYGASVRLPAHRPRSFLYPTGFGTLGYGLPAGIGAQIARPDAPVVVLIGDGGVMFTLSELAAAAQLRIPMIVVIADNGGYGEIRSEMIDRGQPTVAVDLPSPDFPALARALGCHGVRADDGDELRSALGAAATADRPTVVHVRCP